MKITKRQLRKLILESTDDFRIKKVAKRASLMLEQDEDRSGEASKALQQLDDVSKDEVLSGLFSGKRGDFDKTFKSIVSVSALEWLTQVGKKLSGSGDDDEAFEAVFGQGVDVENTVKKFRDLISSNAAEVLKEELGEIIVERGYDLAKAILQNEAKSTED